MNLNFLRPLNLAAIALLQILCFIAGGSGTWIDLVSFIILPSVLSAGAGYLVNDFYDQQTDKINKKHRVEFNKFSYWIWVYLGMNVLALILSFYNSFNLGLIVLGLQLLLWLYGLMLSRIALIGNALVSVISIFTVLIFYFAESIDLHIANIWVLLVSIFLISMARELVKDIEDVNGDTSVNALTLPIMTSSIFTLIVADLMLVCNSVFIAMWTYYAFFTTHYWATLYGIGLSIMGLGIVLLGHLNPSLKKYKHQSLALKIYMFVGMLLVFYLDYVE